MAARDPQCPFAGASTPGSFHERFDVWGISISGKPGSGANGRLNCRWRALPPNVANEADDAGQIHERRRRHELLGRRQKHECVRRKECARMHDGLAERAVRLIILVLGRKMRCRRRNGGVRRVKKPSRTAVNMGLRDETLAKEGKQEKNVESAILPPPRQRGSSGSNAWCFRPLHQQNRLAAKLQPSLFRRENANPQVIAERWLSPNTVKNQ
jgi:hypothetical protein